MVDGSDRDLVACEQRGAEEDENQEVAVHIVGSLGAILYRTLFGCRSSSTASESFAGTNKPSLCLTRRGPSPVVVTCVPERRSAPQALTA